jgi:hypothetical protein
MSLQLYYWPDVVTLGQQSSGYALVLSYNIHQAIESICQAFYDDEKAWIDPELSSVLPSHVRIDSDGTIDWCDDVMDLHALYNELYQKQPLTPTVPFVDYMYGHGILGENNL